MEISNMRSAVLLSTGHDATFVWSAGDPASGSTALTANPHPVPGFCLRSHDRGQVWRPARPCRAGSFVVILGDPLRGYAADFAQGYVFWLGRRHGPLREIHCSPRCAFGQALSRAD